MKEDKEILKLIEKSKKDYDKKSQKAELLARNKTFEKELEEVFSRIDQIYSKAGKKNEFFYELKQKLLTYEPSYNRERATSLREWINFCTRWHISFRWDGQLESLAKFILSSPQIFYYKSNMSQILAELEHKGATNAHLYELGEGTSTLADLLNEKSILILRIDAHTTLKDIRKRWHEIQKLQRRLFDYKAEGKSNFGRDLCWYDLNKKYNLKPRKIAKLWIEHCPEDIDILIIKKIKRENEKEIRETLKGKAVILDDYKELLKQIKNGELKEKFKYIFDDEREFYITGRTNRGKLTPPYLDTIKQAIKRINIYINQFSLNLREEMELISFPPPDEDLTAWEIEMIEKEI